MPIKIKMFASLSMERDNFSAKNQTL